MTTTTQTTTTQTTRRPTRFSTALRGSPVAVRLGLACLALLVACAALSFLWTPYPASAPTGVVNAAPSAAHWFGTDATGADVFSRTLTATRIDLGITLAVVTLALVCGALWGAVAAYVGGWFDAISMRILQVMNAFPALLLAMLVIAALGGGLMSVVFVVALIPLPDYVRLARAEVLTKKHWQFADAARMVGRRPAGVLLRHLLPNSTRPLIAYAGINASWVVATVGSLGYLGLGIEPGSAEWGSMIAGGQSGIVDGYWWISFFPGVGIFLIAAGFHLVGDGLTDHDLLRRGH